VKERKISHSCRTREERVGCLHPKGAPKEGAPKVTPLRKEGHLWRKAGLLKENRKRLRGERGKKGLCD